MMNVLLESGAARARTSNWTAASVVIHGSIVIVAAILTMAPPPMPIDEETLVTIEPWTPPLPTAPVPASPIIDHAGSVPRVPVDLPTIPVPTVSFPEGLPAVPTTTDFPGTSTFHSPGQTPAAPTGAPFSEHQVEQIVRPRADNPSPPYPPSLRAAGIEGDVLARFTVDTLGRVESRSVQIVETSHALFGDAVRDWLTRTRYRPATIGGRPVRQQVEQRIGFSLRR
jgi:TonB family protein